MNAIADFVSNVKARSTRRLHQLAEKIISGETIDGEEFEGVSPEHLEKIVENKSKRQRADDAWKQASDADAECQRITAAIDAAAQAREALHLSIRKHDDELFAQILSLNNELVVARDNCRSLAAKASRAEEFASRAESAQLQEQR